MAKFTSIIQKKTGDVTYIGIVSAKIWFEIDKPFYFVVLPKDFVVCKWSDYHDGVKSNIEGKETIAICRKKEHAELIYNIL